MPSTTIVPANQGHIQSIKVRLDPNSTQAGILFNYTTAVNSVYNTLLYRSKLAYQHRQQLPKQEQGDPSGKDFIPGLDDPDWDIDDFPTRLFSNMLEKYLTRVKHDWFTWADEVPARVFEEAAQLVSVAYQNFFDTITNKNEGQRQYGFPAYRKKRTIIDAGKQTITFKKKPTETWLSDDGYHIALPVPVVRKRRDFGLKGNEHLWIRLSKDRRIRRIIKLIKRKRAQVQKVTFSFSGGYWWASILCRVDDRNRTQPQPFQQHEYQGGKVGIDFAFGDRYIVLSKPVPGLSDKNGIVLAPKHLLREQNRLANITKKLQQATVGLKNHTKLLARFRKLHHRISTERRRWQTMVAKTLTTVFDEIVHEDLDIPALARRKRGGKYSYGRAVADHAPAQFYTILKEQAKKLGKKVVQASRWYPSSKKCSNLECGRVKDKLPVWVRTFECDGCGLVLDRDVNASRNLEHYPADWAPPSRKKNNIERRKKVLSRL